MKRREFIKSIAALGAAAAIPNVSQAKQEPKARIGGFEEGVSKAKNVGDIREIRAYDIASDSMIRRWDLANQYEHISVKVHSKPGQEQKEREVLKKKLYTAINRKKMHGPFIQLQAPNNEEVTFFKI